MVTVDDKVIFDPFEQSMGIGSDVLQGSYVFGTVVMVNYEHKWFSVEYGFPKMRTSFKFCDIGEAVKLYGRG